MERLLLLESEQFYRKDQKDERKTMKKNQRIGMKGVKSMWKGYNVNNKDVRKRRIEYRIGRVQNTVRQPKQCADCSNNPILNSTFSGHCAMQLYCKMHENS